MSKKNKMKRLSRLLSGLVLILVLSFGARAQQPDLLFEQEYPYPILHTLRFETPYCRVLEVGTGDDSNKCIMMAFSDMKNWFTIEPDSVTCPPKVFKVSSTGELMAELTLGYEGRWSSILELFNDPVDTLSCLAVGTVHDNDLHYQRPFMAKFDHDLNLLWQKEIELPEPCRKFMSANCLMDSDGNILCVFRPFDFDQVPNSPCKSYVFRLTPEGELDGFFEYPYSYLWPMMHADVFEYRDGSGDYGCLLEEGRDNSLILARISRNLELVGRETVPGRYLEEDMSIFHRVDLSLFRGHQSCIPVDDGTMIVIGEGILYREEMEYTLTSDMVVGFLWVNQDNEVFSYATVGEGTPWENNDSIKRLSGFTQPVDDAFYFSYAVGQPSGTGYDYTNCFAVVKMDVGGDILWRRYWDRYQPENGMKVYVPQTVATTSDGGCLVAGYSYCSNINNPNSNEPKPNVFTLKFYADGTLSVGEEDTEVHMRPYRLYPNPVGDQLHLQFSPDITPTGIELIDLQGRLVSSQSDQLETVGMEGLPAGVYTLRVTLSNGTVYSDKVVKQ